ncbi:allantoinase [Jatrophihabitans sp. GAS493]|uniref:allantoinase AllB n=1 Tax=Jatrophihabitans sp. GAS493 TaxID=1907575 RepID=UPI000BBF73F5|nr:allantoinase AllB [Jatrophihabitans sp. GAS493]SOD71154.1 allantoinase [Jatrophihabitans sp. GAS493]
MGSAVRAVRARRIVSADGEVPGLLRLRDGVVESIHPFDEMAGLVGLSEAEILTVDDSCVLLPGLVDTHVHVNEPGRTEWEGFATATAAAAAGGVTTLVDMPLNSIPPTTTKAGLQAKRTAATGQTQIDVAFWGGAVPGNVEDLEPLWNSGVVGFKCFLLPSGVEEFPPLSPTELHEAMARISSFGGLLIAHAEEQSVLDAAPAPNGRSYHDFMNSRPPAAESTAIALLLNAVRATGCRTHIVHLSAASALPLIAAAKAEGLPLTVETCPHYLVLTAETIPDGATQFKCCPPIREEANRELLWQALQDGLIDCVVSDHSPCTPDLKLLDVGDFGAAWGGIASVQLGLPVMWTAASERGLQLSDLVRWMAVRPAALAGLGLRGTLQPGASADFSIFAPDETFTVDVAALRYRNPISPYAATTLRGVVKQTYLRGELIDGKSVPGRLIERENAQQTGPQNDMQRSTS